MVGPPPGGGEGGDQVGDATSIDRVLEVLGHPLRRAVIDYCCDADDPAAALDDLVDHVADARDLGDDTEARDRVSLLLHHHHLPKLADASVIDFDPRQGQLRYYPDEDVEEWLARIQSWESDCHD